MNRAPKDVITGTLAARIGTGMPAAVEHSIPSEQMEGPSSLAKAEKGAHRSRPDDDSGGTQTNAQSPDESWVRPYEQERHGKEVPIRGYWRHHAASSPGPEGDAGQGTDNDPSQKEQDPAAALMGKGRGRGRGPGRVKRERAWEHGKGALDAANEQVQTAKKRIADVKKAEGDVKQAAPQAAKWLEQQAEGLSGKAAETLRAAAKDIVTYTPKGSPLIVPLPGLRYIENYFNPPDA